MSWCRAGLACSRTHRKHFLIHSVICSYFLLIMLYSISCTRPSFLNLLHLFLFFDFIFVLVLSSLFLYLLRFLWLSSWSVLDLYYFLLLHSLNPLLVWGCFIRVSLFFLMCVLALVVLARTSVLIRLSLFNLYEIQCVGLTTNLRMFSLSYTRSCSLAMFSSRAHVYFMRAIFILQQKNPS